MNSDKGKSSDTTLYPLYCQREYLTVEVEHPLKKKPVDRLIRIRGKDLPEYVRKNMDAIERDEILIYRLSKFSDKSLAKINKSGEREFLLQSEVTARKNPLVKVSEPELYSRIALSKYIIGSCSVFRLEPVDKKALEEIIAESGDIDKWI